MRLTVATRQINKVGDILQEIIKDIYVQRMAEIQSRIPVRLVRKESNSFSGVLAKNLKTSEISKDSMFADAIHKAAQKYDIDEKLINAVIMAESGFNQNAVSSSGAMGLMQLMPATAKSLGISNPFDPVKNIDGGTKYLAQLLKRYNGDVKMALAAYNCGSGTLNKLGIYNLDSDEQFGKLYSETRSYINKVLGYLSSI